MIEYEEHVTNSHTDAGNVGTHGIISPFDRSGGFSEQKKNMPSIDSIEVEK